MSIYWPPPCGLVPSERSPAPVLVSHDRVWSQIVQRFNFGLHSALWRTADRSSWRLIVESALLYESATWWWWWVGWDSYPRCSAMPLQSLDSLISLRAKLSGAVYCYRSYMSVTGVCNGRAGRRYPNLTTASARAMFAERFFSFHYENFMLTTRSAACMTYEFLYMVQFMPV